MKLFNFNIKKSLASRIVFYVLLFSTLLFLISLTLIYTFSKKSLERATLANVETITQNTLNKTSQVIYLAENIVCNYIWMLENNHLDADSIFEITQLIVKNNLNILGAAIAFKPNYYPNQGRYFAPYSYRNNDSILTVQLGNTNYEYFVMDWYQIPMMINKPYWTEPYFDTGGANALMTTYSVPFFQIANGKKQAVGILTIDLSLDWLTEIVSSVSILETGYAAVISKNGTFVTHPDPELIMNQTLFSYATEIGNPAVRELGRTMQKNKTGNAKINLDGKTNFVFYTTLPGSNWTLAVVFPKSEVYAPLKGITITLIILIVIGLILQTTVISRIVNEQIAPLKSIANSAIEVAQGNFNNPLPFVNTHDEMRDLRDSFELMQEEIANYIVNLKQTTSVKEKIESELRIAREIQMGMIPKIFPPFPNIKEIDLYAMLEPAKEVGGDLYDFFMIDDKHLCFAIGDVSGKGVPASLFMAVTRTLLRSVAPNQKSPAIIVKALNDALVQGNESNMFVTFFIGIININTGDIKYTNAGHNPPLLMGGKGKIRYLPITKDIPIGLYEDFEFKEFDLKLAPHDKILLYTDGVTEAEDKNEKLYSEQRLIRCASMHIREHPKDLLFHVTMDVAEHVQSNPQSDDLTMLSIVYNG